MSEKEFDKLLQRYLDGVASEKEVELINQWYDKMTSAEEIRLAPDVEQKLKHSYDGRLSDAIRKKRSAILWPKLSAAACISAVLLIAGFYLLEPLAHNGETSQLVALQRGSVLTAADTQRVSLPDGTRVTLHPGSSIQTAPDFDRSDRKVTLSGEAFFEVTHNPEKPFYVYAEQVVTKVLGTSFLVRAFPHDKDVRVAVISGKVSVIDQDQPTGDSVAAEVILLPNQQAIYDREQKTVLHTLVTEPKVVTSMHGVMRFENKPVTEIFKALQEKYGVEIRFDEVTFSKCILTTSSSGASLYETIDIICEAIGASYRVDGIRVEISGAGCN